MSKRIKRIYIGVSCGLIFLLLIWIQFFADDYGYYSSGKHYYETNGMRGNDLADAYKYFKKANGFWDSEQYLELVEDEMYAFLKDYREQGKFPHDQFGAYTNILSRTDRYSEEVAKWIQEREEQVARNEERERLRIERNPPYEGMRQSDVRYTLWGEPTHIETDSWSKVTVYKWVKYRNGNPIVRAVYVSDGKAIKVHDSDQW